MLGNINSNWIFLYFILISVTGFITMGVDKRAAVNNHHRISENFLFGISICGASLGVWLGMYIFHHKTRKMKFVLGLPLLFLVQIILLIYFNQKLI